ncbi:hypothetical protein SmJEL517_g00868 [Synchytrium microbalum]|uniref:Bestrophin n=1 Tax=Synchytrium microbalum TaxID=1806994 RepID=A0A507C639_9FUNG|nr:uncharacterized protein SmJEL517_g00868 [Synchytrium microbalum]TPX37060.1 hypothetical protein SmJEL517_g00868 [Synchytrium microbalum]
MAASKKKTTPVRSSRKHVRLEISNSTSYRYRDLFRLTGSVAGVVLLPTLFFTLWATLWVVLYMEAQWKWIAISPQLITVLGVTLGLLLVFRTNTAYDRYWEGRRLWGTYLTQSRNLARYFWVSVVSKGDNPLRDLEEKKGAINLILAFLYASKHYLRAEDSFDYPDTYPYLSHLADFKDENDPPEIRNLPIYILTHLAAYVAKMRAQDKLDVGTQGQCMTSLAALTDSLSALERIRSSPIPLAYSIHLKHCLFVYLLGIPFQVVNGTYYFAIPIAAIASFTLIGIESIGCEIENPFGTDANDLPIEDFCDSMRHEIARLIRRKATFDPADWSAPFIDDIVEYEHMHLSVTIKEADQLLKRSQTGINVSVGELTEAIEKIEAEKKSIVSGHRKSAQSTPPTPDAEVSQPDGNGTIQIPRSPDGGTAFGRAGVKLSPEQPASTLSK